MASGASAEVALAAAAVSVVAEGVEEEGLYNETTAAPSPSSDLSAYIARRLGPRHLPLSTIVPISAVYSCICALGVLGNASVCAVICRNKYMQTPTNVYLANLAVSDLLTHLVGEDFVFKNVVKHRYS